MEYYHQLITEKSFKLLQNLCKKHKFILIGGWAVFFLTHNLKSKDIDLIIDYEMLNQFKEEYSVAKNNRLKKYEIKQDGIDVDIYLPFYSELGLPIEEIKKNIIQREGFTIPRPEILVILKQTAYNQRQGSPKGEKDKIDIFSLLSLPEFNWNLYKKLLVKHRLKDMGTSLQNLLKQTNEVKELGLNQAKISKLKKQILSSLSTAS